MHKLTLEQYLREENNQIQQAKTEEQIGLFTFYKQQEESENLIRTHFARKKKQSLRKSKGKSKFKLTKITQPVNQEQKQQKKQNDRSTANNSTSPVKHIEAKIQNPHNSNHHPSKFKQQFQLKKVALIIKDQNQTNSCYELPSSAEITKYKLVINPQNGFTAKPLRRIEQLLQLNHPNLVMDSQKAVKSDDFKQKDRKMSNLAPPMHEEITQTTNSTQAQTHMKKACKIPTIKQKQQQSRANSIERYFLKKIRDQPTDSQKEEMDQKSVKSSNIIENLHKQNKKYFCNLINNFYLPQNQNSQAAKMLRETLKFPNLNFKLKSYSIKTQGDVSPASVKKPTNHLKTTSCRKDTQSNMKNKSKESIQAMERGLIKPSSNERFKLLFRKEIQEKG